MTPSCLLVAFGFAQLPMLGWLVAAAAPLLIHLLTRRRYQEMPWAATEYLLAALRRQARRIRLEQWLLLLVRTLLIVLLVLAVAEPYLERMAPGGAPAGRVHRVLVFDGSYSMAASGGGQTCFQRARQLARQIVEESREGDAFSLVLMARPVQTIVGRPALEPSRVLSEIDALHPVHTGADLGAALAAAQRLIESAAREDPGLAAHEVYLLTDLQRVDFWAQMPQDARAALRRRANQLAQMARLVVIDLGRAQPANAAVTSLRVLEPLVTPRRAVSVEATIKNFGSQGLSGRSVELLVDGRSAARQAVDLPPGGEQTVLFTWRFDTPGEHFLEVRLPDDALEVDNHRWLAVPVPEAVRVLCIDGQPTAADLAGATGYLVLALAPAVEGSDEYPVQVDRADESAITERPLADYDVVFLCRVGQFTAREARLLRGYLDHGGSLVFFLGEGVIAERYNQQLAGDPARRLLPARLGPIDPQPQWRIDPLEFAHPIVRSFRGEGRSSLLTVPVMKHYRLQPVADSRARVALGLPNGDPLLIEEAIGRGRVLLVATSADPSWTALPLWPSFVPLVQEMLAYCAGSWQRERNRMVGELLEGIVPAPDRRLPVEVEDPAGRIRSLRAQSEGEEALFSYDETMLSGVYRVRFGSAESTRPPRYYAFNLDTRQSDLARLDAAELGDELWQGVDFQLVTTWEGGPAESTSPLIAPLRLPAQLLYGVLGLLFVELLLAWRFGHHG